MTTLRQAAQQALEALESVVEYDYHRNPLTKTDAACDDAINVLLAVLAKPNKCTHGVTDGNCKECYMAESEQEPLSDEQIDALEWPPSGTATVRDIVRLIEAAHGIKGEA